MSDGWAEYGPGTKVKRLGGEGDAGFYLIRMDPGAKCLRHSHPQRETTTVLEGAVAVSTWPWSDPEGRQHVDKFCPIDSPFVDLPPGYDHELRAHPEHGVLLLTVARPDWAAA